MSLLPVIGAIGGAVVQGIQNRQNYKRSIKMYQMQRQDALADWNMQNQYNSPEQQMRRLREAGLNPNLVYGNGADAQSQGMPRQTNIAPAEIDLSQIGNSVNNYMNVAQAQQDMVFKQQQTDNLKAQNTLLTQQQVINQNNIIKQQIENEIKGATKEDVIKSFNLKNAATTQKTSKDFFQTHLLAKNVENYDQNLASQLSVRDAVTQNLKNQVENRNLITNSQLQVNAANIILTKARAETEPYKRKQLFEVANKLMKDIEWTDALNKTKIGTSIGNTVISGVKNLNPLNLLKQPKTNKRR